jgi:malate dehydrogenase
MNKIAIIGAGRVGEATAHFLAQEDICRELVLIDVREGVAQGVALDILQSAPLFGFDTHVTGHIGPENMAGADIVIVTAGIPRKPGMSRSDVLDTNVKIIDSIVDDVLRYAPNSMILVVSNPVDVLTYRAWQRTGWSRNRVLGQAGVLDSARMAAFVAMETGFSMKDIAAMVLGGHGDAMVPMVRYTTISGIAVTHFLDKTAIDRIVERTRHGGAEILSLRQTSSAYDAPAAAVVAMVGAIAQDRRRVLPTVAILQGEYGETDIAMGVPCVLGKEGLEKVVELELTEEERYMFKTSLAGVRQDLTRIRD